MGLIELKGLIKQLLLYILSYKQFKFALGEKRWN